MLINLDQIIVPENRIRQEYSKEKFEGLKDSIRHGGLINAIIVIERNGKYELKAGEHRLKAIIELNKEGKDIPNVPRDQIRAELWGQLTRRTALLLEWDENERREDFTFLEKSRFIRYFHETMKAESSDWTAELTAHMLRISTASISHYLRIEESARDNPEVAKAETMKAAVKRMRKIASLKERRDDATRNAPETIKRAEQILHRGDCTIWLKSISESSVDFVNFDPPWGEEASHKVAENWESFDDSSEYSYQLTKDILPELFRVLKQDRFLVIWLRILEAKEIIALAESFGFNHKYAKTPCIWYKPDKVSDQQRFPEKTFIESYETFLFLRKGDPLLHEEGAQNVFVEPRIPVSATIHPTEKPVSLMRRLINLTTSPGEVILDPCAGSASCMVAALDNNRRALGCELNKKYHERGITRLAESLAKFREANAKP
jgi:ParB-like chromosome segregation protein Spo0J